jgi:Tfp pilus assembly protein PilN
VRAVNLLPKDVQQQARAERRPRPLVLLAPVAVLVPVLALAFAFMNAHNDVSSRQTELSGLEAALASLPAPAPTAAASNTQLHDQLSARATAVAMVLGKRLAWDSMLGDLSRALPNDVWLSTLSATAPAPLGTASTAPVAPVAPTPGAAPTGLTMSGYTYSQTSVARLLARLATIPSLQDVQLQQSANQPIGTRTVVGFTIVANVRQPGGSQ